MRPNRITAMGITVGILLAGCTAATSAPETTATSTVTTTIAAPTTTPPATTTTTETVVETTDAPPEPVRYAVVAEERARRLAVLDPTGGCAGGEEPCTLSPLFVRDLEERPHNLTAIGAVVFATHPAAGAMSRVDVERGEILTAQVGTEPHDVKVGATGTLLVADEAGGALLTVDPETLAVVDSVDLPGRPHDLIVDGDAVWVTLIGRRELARVEDGRVDLHPTTGSPHDLIMDADGQIWFSSWNSDTLSVYDPASGATVEAPAGVTEPHHFAIGPDDVVWVSDNGGSTVVGFTSAGPISVPVGPTPHHLAFLEDFLVVAVSGTGEAVFVRNGGTVAAAPLSTGLHGVAVVEFTQPG